MAWTLVLDTGPLADFSPPDSCLFISKMKITARALQIAFEFKTAASFYPVIKINSFVSMYMFIVVTLSSAEN
jgi:hypothetical protein